MPLARTPGNLMLIVKPSVSSCTVELSISENQFLLSFGASGITNTVFLFTPSHMYTHVHSEASFFLMLY